ncbi:MAG: hypothetical protein GY760_22495, partial [Deltaproteobacteria bacterium]|nr:hypothetical protein [Deltaproteobacteria bacterium]
MNFIIRKTIYLFIFFLLFLTGCTSFNPVMYESFLLPEDASLELDSHVVVPEVEIFISAFFYETYDIPLIDVGEIYLPIEEIPFLEEDVLFEQVVVSNSNIPNTNQEDEISNMDKLVIDENDIVEDIQLENDELFRITGKLSEELYIVLNGEGWIYIEDESGLPVDLEDRSFDKGQTVFSFNFPEAGNFSLLFSLQDLILGKMKNVAYEVLIEGEAVEVEILDSDYPVVIDPNNNIDEVLGNPDFGISVKEENIPDLVAYFDDFISEDIKPEREIFLEAFFILEKQGGYEEYLVKLAENCYKYYPYDNGSAELLFKAAQSIEQPGSLQDIPIALDLYKLVRDYFPLSIYCDHS